MEVASVSSKMFRFSKERTSFVRFLNETATTFSLLFIVTKFDNHSAHDEKSTNNRVKVLTRLRYVL